MGFVARVNFRGPPHGHRQLVLDVQVALHWSLMLLVGVEVPLLLALVSGTLCPGLWQKLDPKLPSPKSHHAQLLLKLHFQVLETIGEAKNLQRLAIGLMTS